MSNDETDTLTKDRTNIARKQTQYAYHSASIEKLLVRALLFSYDQPAVLADFGPRLDPSCFAHEEWNVG